MTQNSGFAGSSHLGEWSLLPPGLLGCPRGPLRVVGGQRLGEVPRGIFCTLVDGLSGLRIEFGGARLHLLQLLGGDRISDDGALEPTRDRLTVAAAHDGDATDGVELLARSMAVTTDVNGWVAELLHRHPGDANRWLLMALRGDRVGIHPVVITDHHMAAAPLLRRIHSVVCVGQQIFRGRAGACDGDADAGRDDELVTGDLHRPADRPGQSRTERLDLCGGVSSVLGEVLTDEDELVTGQSDDGVAFTEPPGVTVRIIWRVLFTLSGGSTDHLFEVPAGTERPDLQRYDST